MHRQRVDPPRQKARGKERLDLGGEQQGVARDGVVKRADADPVAREKELIEEYREKFFNPYRAADVGQIDEVIEPRETRPRLARALEVLRTKVQQNPPKKHGLCPV